MNLKLFKTLWGHEGPLNDAIHQAQAAGFHGLEGMVPYHPAERESFLETLAGSGLELIAEISTCTDPGLYVPQPGKSPREHLASLEDGIVRSIEAKPRFINTMAGSDSWNADEAFEFFSGVLELERTHRIAISCETHRGRYTYSPWLTRDLLKQLPDLKITCDFSHWCVVSERLILDEDPTILELLAGHVYHIHSRVGYAQGPQVPDPRAPEYAAVLASHERWWDTLWDGMDRRGVGITTMTPEFGPDGYLQCQPFTRLPVADLWTINQWTAHRQLNRFKNRYPNPVDPAIDEHCNRTTTRRPSLHRV